MEREEELRALLADLESDRTERKQALGDGEAVRKAICAFANDLPDHRKYGVVFVGVTDGGSPANKPADDDLLKKLADIGRDGSIIPLPHLTVSKLSSFVAAVQVQPADSPPVRWHQQVWVRVGPSTQPANEQQLRILSEKRRARDQPFDVRPLHSARLVDLDATLFRTSFLPLYQTPGATDERPLPDQLAAARFATAGHEPRPTALGALCLAHEPTNLIPGAYIQFLRIDGDTLTDPILDRSWPCNNCFVTPSCTATTKHPTRQCALPGSTTASSCKTLADHSDR
ncbi:MAG: AlbA family DNA-binding domain-containing protein [Terriglobales bacterium]